MPTIVRIDSRLGQIVSLDAELEKVADGFA